MKDLKIADGITNFISYVRRMNLLTDEQLDILLSTKISQNPDYYTSLGVTIPGHIQFIKQMSLLTDDQIRKALMEQRKDPVYDEIFTDNEKKKLILDMQKSAKDIKGDPKNFARKVA